MCSAQPTSSVQLTRILYLHRCVKVHQVGGHECMIGHPCGIVNVANAVANVDHSNVRGDG